MEKLSKSTRRVLEVFRTSEPDESGACFRLENLDFSGLTQEQVQYGLERLTEIHALVCVNKPFHIYRLTDLGWNWTEYSSQDRSDVFFRSVLCPVLVSIITNLVIHGMPLLLRLLTARG